MLEETRTWEGGGREECRRGAPPVPARWRLLRRLGRGGQAEVWLAEDLVLRERVALKLFGTPPGPEPLKRWRREVRLGRTLRHPGIVRIHDLVEHRGSLFAVMEPVLGGTLADRIEREGPLPVAEVVRVAEALLEVLAYLHERGIVHRDVKPSNVLFDPDGAVRLGDLGLVRELDPGAAVTRTAAVLGTPAYMAPEQLAGGAPAPSWDLYALGVTLYEALAGRRPFDGDSAFLVAEGHMHRRPPRLRSLRAGCPRWLARFVERLLEKRPEDRWPSAAAARAALRRRRARWSPRTVRGAAAAAAGVVAVVGAWTAWTWLAAADPARLLIEGRAVTALDGGGRELWRREVGWTVRHAAAANLLPRRGREVLLAGGERGAAHARYAILDRTGRVILSRRLRAPYPPWRRMAQAWQVPALVVEDLDRDGLEEAVVLLAHRYWYPSGAYVLGVSRGRLEAHPVLANSGALHAVALGDLDGDGVRDLVLVGLNNPMGFQTVVVALDGRELRERGAVAFSPDLVVDVGRGGGPGERAMLFYTPLGSAVTLAPGQVSVQAGPGGVELRIGEARLRLDPSGNPEGSPLAGRDGTARREFWRGLWRLCTLVEERPPRAAAAWEAFAAAHPLVLAERGARTAAALLAARAMADARRYHEATRVLEATASQLPEERDLWLRLGEYRLLAGDRSGGRSAILRSTAPAHGGRTAYDAYLLLALDAALHADPEAFREAADAMRRMGGEADVGAWARGAEPMLLFAQGRWSDPRLAGAGDDPMFPAVRWLRMWAALERGARPREVLATAGSRIEGVDLPELGRLVRAEALRRIGRLAEAVGEAEEALDALERAGRRSFEAHAWVPLARYELGRCLLEAGGTARALAQLARAAAAAPGTWYGRAAARLSRAARGASRGAPGGRREGTPRTPGARR